MQTHHCQTSMPTNLPKKPKQMLQRTFLKPIVKGVAYRKNMADTCYSHSHSLRADYPPTHPKPKTNAIIKIALADDCKQSGGANIINAVSEGFFPLCASAIAHNVFAADCLCSRRALLRVGADQADNETRPSERQRVDMTEPREPGANMMRGEDPPQEKPEAERYIETNS